MDQSFGVRENIQLVPLLFRLSCEVSMASNISDTVPLMVCVADEKPEEVKISLGFCYFCNPTECNVCYEF